MSSSRPKIKSVASMSIGAKRKLEEYACESSQPLKGSEASDTDGSLEKTQTRPPWDLKGRLKDMEMLTAMLRDKIRHSEADFPRIDPVVKSTQVSDISRLNEELVSLRMEIEKLRSLKENIKGGLDSTRKPNLQSSIDCPSEVSSDNAVGVLKSKLDRSDAFISDDKSLSFQHEIERLNQEISILKNALSQAERINDEKSLTIGLLDQKLHEAQGQIAELKDKLQHGELVRRQLHNSIQELRGNIRVFCRIRPLQRQNSNNIQSPLEHISFSSTNEQEINLIQEHESVTGKFFKKQISFSFDKIFRPDSTQSQIFEEVSHLVQSALDGYHICIFAYGQTGSGKTYTMEGPPGPMLDGNSGDIGIIPRAVNQIFESVKDLKSKGWRYEIEVSFLEIYNETIRDLLTEADTNRRHEIRHDPHSDTTSVTDLSRISVSSREGIYELFQKALKNRSVGETQTNERSSRSHSVFILKLIGINDLTNEESEGILNLIDLAGSERISSSGVTGNRLKETQHINKSLSSLGDVIASLANKDNHVPYRNSKLTYLLQNSLGGNCKCLMFVNISPDLDHIQETLCSLRFASKVNSCNIGPAKRQATRPL